MFSRGEGMKEIVGHRFDKFTLARWMVDDRATKSDPQMRSERKFLRGGWARKIYRSSVQCVENSLTTVRPE